MLNSKLTRPQLTNSRIVTADEWVRGFRDVPHAQQDTIGACEGYHSAIKGNELGRNSRLQGRRVDWLLWLLWNEV